MFKLRLLIAAILCITLLPLDLSAAAAQQGVPAQPTGTANASAGYSIRGTVASASGGSLSGASVRLNGPASLETRTGVDGTYAFSFLPAGTYSVQVTAPGFGVVSRLDVPVSGDRATDVDFALTPITTTSLQEIGRVNTSQARVHLNSTGSSIAVIGQQAITDQGAFQVTQLLNQTPGIVDSQVGQDASEYGAVVIPTIRGGLPWETQPLLDGHPLSVGEFGDYPDQFIPAFLLQGVEIAKGPGVTTDPTIEYAVNGSVNFQTLEPTSTPQVHATFGTDTYGGTFGGVRATGRTLNKKLGYALGYISYGSQGPLDNSPAYDILSPATMVNGTAIGSTTSSSPINGATGPYPLPGAQQSPNYTSLVACCERLNSNFNNRSALAKLSYDVSPAITATATYLDSASRYDRDGIAYTLVPTAFAPAASYAGSIQPGIVMTNANTRLPNNVQNSEWEPIFQVDLKATTQRDTFLARFYNASINRFTTNATLSPSALFQTPLQLYGTTSGGTTFNGQTEAVTIPGTWFGNGEQDKISGGSFIWNHTIGAILLTGSFDRYGTSSTAYSYSAVPGATPTSPYVASYTTSVAAGSGQQFPTYMLRAIIPFNHWTMTLADYQNGVVSTYQNGIIAGTPNFQTTSQLHNDPRGSIAFQLDDDTSLRLAAGSSLAPPFLGILQVSSQNPAQVYSPGASFVTVNENAGSLRPETAFGYDLGADHRFDKNTVLSGDLYLTNLWNQFLTEISLSPTGFTPPGGSSTIPVYLSKNVNGPSARYEGIELALRHDPATGFGYVAQGALLRAYSTNLSPGIYTTATSVAGTNLAVLPSVNFLDSGSGFNGFSNQAIPYAQGYGELHWRSPKGGVALLGLTYYGHNNSLNVPAFVTVNSTIRGTIGATKKLFWQITANNLFGAYSNTYDSAYAGAEYILANGKLGFTTASAMGPPSAQFSLGVNLGR